MLKDGVSSSEEEGTYIVAKQGQKQEPKVGMTVTATSSTQDAPCGETTISFSKGDKIKITKLKIENGEWYATEDKWKALCFPLRSSDLYIKNAFDKGVVEVDRVFCGPDWKWGD